MVADVYFDVAVCNLFDCTKGLSADLCVVDVRDFPTVEFKMAFAPGGDIDLQLIVANGCDKLLHSGAFSDGQRMTRLFAIPGT